MPSALDATRASATLTPVAAADGTAARTVMKIADMNSSPHRKAFSFRQRSTSRSGAGAVLETAAGSRKYAQ